MDSIQPYPWHRLTLAAVAAVGIALSAFVALHFSDTQIEERRHQSIVEATSFADDLEQYLQNREMIAKTVGAVFEAPDLSMPHPLASIGKKILVLTPEIEVMAWIPQVDPARLHEVLSAFSAAGRLPRIYGPNFETLVVSDPRRALYPVMDVEPRSDDQLAGIGMEVSRFPLRKEAFEQARDEQRVIASAPVGLLHSPTTAAYILYAPVYNDRGFAGCIMFVFRVDRLLNGFVQARRIPMNFRIYDATDPGQMIVGFTRQGEIETVNSSDRSDVAQLVRHTVDFAGRKMLVQFDPGPDLVQVGLQQGFMVGFLGLILTGMLLCSMYYFMRSSLRLASEIATSNSMRESLQLMNRELVHRVGNLLAVAQGMIRLSYNASLSTSEFKDSILARLQALHQSVGLINREDWKGVWLHELLQTELAPILDRINLSGRDALLKPKATQSLSLLFYELMTNSSKHGALSKHGGSVTAEWEIKESEAGRLFCFRWQEHDHGVIQPPTRQGFGTKLLTRLVPGDLSGRATLSYESNGFRYELEAPVENVIEQETNTEVKGRAVATLRVISGYSDRAELTAQAN